MECMARHGYIMKQHGPGTLIYILYIYIYTLEGHGETSIAFDYELMLISLTLEHLCWVEWTIYNSLQL